MKNITSQFYVKILTFVSKFSKAKIKKIEDVITFIGIQKFAERLALVTYSLATAENLSSQLKTRDRADQIFNDATRISPQTVEGRFARVEAQKYAGRITQRGWIEAKKCVDESIVKSYIDMGLRIFKQTGYDSFTGENVIGKSSTSFQEYQKTWVDTANFIASDMACIEGSIGQKLVERATHIFSDATKYSPQTEEGKKVRTVAKSVTMHLLE